VESHDFWELCYVIDGEITLFMGEESKVLSGNQLILIAPNVRHSYVSADGNKTRAFVICFGSVSQALAPISGITFVPDGVQTGSLERILDECENTFHMNEREHLEVLSASRFGGQQVILLQLEYLLINLVRQVSGETNSDIVFFSDQNFYGDLASVMQRYLREHVNKKLTLNDICGKFSYSRSFLCKTFKEQTGETLITCFNRMKMEEAERLLKETTDSVSNVAYALGFREVKYFDSLFKKHTGVTPVAYREKYAK
jgi:AraC-like DNA-binding protein